MANAYFVRIAATHDHLGCPDAHLQRPSEPGAANELNLFADAKSKRQKPVMQTLFGGNGPDDGGITGME